MDYSQIGIAERCQFSRGDLIDDRWRVDAFLGEGTFGQVFRVVDNTGNAFALKLLKLWEVIGQERAGLLKRFDREYETGRIASNFLVHSVYKGIVKGNAYIVMEYCRGGDLVSAQRKTRLDMPLLARHVLLGLRDLHANGKVHRDLKPENVLLRDNDHAVLTDFGIAGDQNNRLTGRKWNGKPTQLFGTYAYMPPEQVNPPSGNATVLPTTDIFSFGVMLYQLLTGNLPFGPLESQGDLPSYLNNGSTGQWDRSKLSKLSDGAQWLNVIEGCLKPKFKERLQTIDDVLNLMPMPHSGEAPVIDQKAPGADFIHDISRGVKLRVMHGEEPGRTYVLNDLFEGRASVLFMGRYSDDTFNHIAITENETCYISRQHCTIEKDLSSGAWIIRDGQFRIGCPTAHRAKSSFPCGFCTASCFPGDPRRKGTWKESLNGTFVNSDVVPMGGLRLKPGDIISIGDTKIRVEGI